MLLLYCYHLRYLKRFCINLNSILVIIRTNTDVELFNQNKRRLFELPKIEYSLRSLNSLINSIKFCKNKYQNIKFKIIIVDDKSKDENLSKMKNLITRSNLNIKLISLDHKKYKDVCKKHFFRVKIIIFIRFIGIL